MTERNAFTINSQGLYQCHVCEKFFGRHLLTKHIRSAHMEVKDYYDTFFKSPDEGICEICGKETNFYGGLYNGQYRDYCSITCKNDPQSSSMKRSKATTKERYGAENIFATEFGKKLVREKMIEKYGVDNPQKCQKIKEQTAKTNFEKYGGVAPACSQEVQEKMKATTKERFGVENFFQRKDELKKIYQKKYGVDNPFAAEDIKKKIRQTNLEKYGAENPSQSTFFKDKMLSQGYIPVKEITMQYGIGWRTGLPEIPIIRDRHYVYVHQDYIPAIEEFYENNRCRSNFELEIYSFIKSHLTKEEIEIDTRKIIKPYELDMYIPSKKIAIECDGIYWHSEAAGKDRNYHLNKTILCQQQGIRLIHVTDWEWRYKNEIIQSLILSALGIYDKKIFARNCSIIPDVDEKTARKFLKENHLQGSVPSTQRLGLYYEGELVQLITLGESRFTKNETELLRMCSKKGYLIVGGFSRLVSHVSGPLVSYVDRSKFTGESYLKAGFQTVGYTRPSYFYYKNGLKINRMTAQKHKLEKLLGSDNVDTELSETVNMLRNGFVKIYDCGTMKVRK